MRNSSQQQFVQLCIVITAWTNVGVCVCVCGRYELCNQYGIYLMDEANVETHGFEPSFTEKNAHPACWPEWHDAIVDRGVRMVSTLQIDQHSV